MNNQAPLPPIQGPIPEDLAGYQCLKVGIIQDGDILVHGAYRAKKFADREIGTDIAYSILYWGSDVYRKMECARHLDHDPIEQPTAHKAKTFDDGKPPLGYLPWKGLREVAMVQAYGHKKYGDFYNYKDGMEVGRHCSCAVRHIADYMDGRDLDEESNRNHLAHAVCRLLFVLENLAEGTAIDDRYKPKTK